MTSPREMSLQVDSTSSSSSPKLSVIRGPLQFGNNANGMRGSIEGQEPAFVPMNRESNSYRPSMRPQEASIVAQSALTARPPQSSHDLNDQVKAPPSRQVEDTERPSTDIHPTNASRLHPGTHIRSTDHNSVGDRHTHELSIYSSQSWQPRIEEPTTSSDIAHIRNYTNRTEETREQHLGLMVEQNTFQTQVQAQLPHTSSVALASLSQLTPTPPAHTATAAEIALGIAPSYHLRQRNFPESIRIEGMGSHHDSRSSQIHRRMQQESASKEEDPPLTAGSRSEGKDRDGEESTDRTAETVAVGSPGVMTPIHDSGVREELENPVRSLSVPLVGTPSTVSTAPSTDDASLGTDYKLDDPSLLPHLLQPQANHHRSQSWGEEGLLPGLSLSSQIQVPSEGGQGSSWMQSSSIPPSTYSNPQSYHASHSGHQRVASFRNDSVIGGPGGGTEPQNSRYGMPSTSRAERGWTQQQQHQQQSAHRQFAGDQQVPFISPQGRGVQVDVRGAQVYGTHPYQQVARKPQYATQASHTTHSSTATPPRNTRNQRQQGQNSHRPSPSTGVGSPHQPSATPQRSSSEILKTLLRKKACLYEPDTSRSVALVTWLVGRALALEYGFFSRQQLQSGVHACVADKIDSGTITRTKVNRCMQIILNSCFHYIIPRSDGTEENGDSFRALFARSVHDDSFLLSYLPVPWNDLVVKTEIVLQASMNEAEERPQTSGKGSISTPKSSPRLTGVSADRSPSKESTEGENPESKRAVLLCFNENVRSAEDVFRCHNEFIRDTANASHLQLSAQEWRTFFGREAARAPYLWGNVGIPMLSVDYQSGPARQPDVLGQMSQDELGKFRTTWCTKRYDHDHELCGFAHVEVNGGWLRRNPNIHTYQDEMCKYVTSPGDKRAGSSFFVINECSKGAQCEKAHSVEEIVYHPNRYKAKVCSSSYSRSGGCVLGDVCPHLHPSDSTRPMKKPTDGRTHGGRHSRKNEQASNGGKSQTAPPMGSPVIYASPAPFSSFERQLAMPGLQSLFRRHSSIIRAHVRTAGKCKCCYSHFGDDWGINDGASLVHKSVSGLPPTRRV